MPVKPTRWSYHDSVFINCPFDDAYRPLLQAVIYTVYRCGFYPTSALSEDNALHNRLDKILRIIEKCKYGIHDISRTEITIGSNLPRFNMPFEPGIFFGAGYFGSETQKDKNALVFERVKYVYQQYLSDINGIDTKAHNNDIAAIISHIRNWLSPVSPNLRIPGAQALIKEYNNFLKRLPAIARDMGFPDINNIPLNDYCMIIEELEITKGLIRIIFHPD